MFNGFESIAAYLRECDRLGFDTDILWYKKKNEKYEVLLTSYGGNPPSWHLFDQNERELLTDVVHEFDYKTQLSKLGYLPC